MVRKAILSLADGRTCASDEVVAEMLKVLEAEELHELSGWRESTTHEAMYYLGEIFMT